MFAMRCPTDMSTTGSRPTRMGPLIAAVSAIHQLWVTGVCFVPFSLSCYGFMSGIFTYEQFPCKSHPVLLCLDLFGVDGLYCAMVYCTGVFNRFLYFTIMIIHYLATCIRGYLGVQESASQGPSSSLPSVRFSPHRAILNPLNGHAFIHIAVVYGMIPATTQWWESCYLNQQVTLYS